MSAFFEVRNISYNCYMRPRIGTNYHWLCMADRIWPSLASLASGGSAGAIQQSLQAQSVAAAAAAMSEKKTDAIADHNVDTSSADKNGLDVNG